MKLALLAIEASGFHGARAPNVNSTWPGYGGGVPSAADRLPDESAGGANMKNTVVWGLAGKGGLWIQVESDGASM
jgi:hypothetical protein